VAVWGFTEKYLIGQHLFGLPVEELLFFVCIPYACIFTYYCFRILLGTDFKIVNEKVVTNIIIGITVLLGIIFYDRMYTSWTAAGLTAFLLFIKFVAKPKWLSLFYYSHMFLIIPFLIVNGILTGTGLDEPVVWYNDLENMSMRIFTIPLEDIFYGMLMLMLNTYLFEFFMQKAGVGQDDQIVKINSFWDVVKF
jgi:lycopene cyclase domain-containing protein